MNLHVRASQTWTKGSKPLGLHCRWFLDRVRYASWSSFQPLRKGASLLRLGMRLITLAASAALAALHASDSNLLASRFHNLTPVQLNELDSALRERACPSNEVFPIVGTAILRRVAHSVLGKRHGQIQGGGTDIESALRAWDLPLAMQERLRGLEKHDGQAGKLANQMPPPSTWFEALERLKEKHSLSKAALWCAVINHPMTEYVPPQCANCGHQFPDRYGPGAPTDAEIGLEEVTPTDAEKPLVRSGWYRGPRGQVKFVFTCPSCATKTQWFRSSDPKTILNPHGWGRLCGEQEDLRAALAEHLEVTHRVAVPLDWDHTWSEYRKDDGTWSAVEDDARNFCVRLDEGIGAWTRVIVVSASDAEFSADVTDEYLRCGADAVCGVGWRADSRHEANMDRYKATVEQARSDPTGAQTQSGTVNGYVLERAQMGHDDVSRVLRAAVKDFGSRAWWDVPIE